ncbi:MAG: hypothetical protein U0746_17000 [Gemmataceae bacterium]
MAVSRVTLSLLGVLQLFVAGSISHVRTWHLIVFLLLVVGAAASMACSAVPTRRLAAGCVCVNAGVCCLLVGATRAYAIQDSVALDVVRIVGSAPFCASLLAGWIWSRYPRPRTGPVA